MRVFLFIKFLSFLVVASLIISFFSSVAEAAATTTLVNFPECDNCIQVYIYRDAAGSGFASNCGDLPLQNGKKAFKAIIRSAQLESNIKALLPLSASTIVAYYYDGTDATTDGTWIIPSTGEILYTAGSTYKFAYLNFGVGEPNGGILENALALLLMAATTSYYRVVDIGAPSVSMTSANSAVLCMYQYDVIVSVAVSSADAQTGSSNLILGSEYVRYQVFPQHVSWANALAKCENIKVADPNTGVQTMGYLATFYPTAEWRLVKEMLTAKSDVRFHSSDASFGAWVGYTSYTSDTDTWMLQQGTDTTESIKMVNNNNCVSQTYCSQGNSPAVNERVAIGTNKNYKFIWNSASFTLPYICMWRFIVNGTIKSSSSYTKDFTDETSFKVIQNVTLFLVRHHSIWKITADAETDCWNQKQTNEAGDTVRGTLGTFFKDVEWKLATNLSNASLFMSDGNEDYIGINTGLSSTPGYNWGTDLSDLKTRLVWNRGGSISVGNDDGSDDVFPWSPAGYQGTGCPYGCSCPSGGMTRFDDSQQVSMAYRDDTQTFVTMNYPRRRGFFCTFRFPIRRRIHPQIIVEYHSTPMVWADTKRFCARRQITGLGGVLVNGTNFLKRLRSGTALLQDAADFATDGTIREGPLWVGQRNASADTCLAWRRVNKYFEWFACPSYTFEFFCYFELRKTFSATRSISADVTVTKTKTLQSLTKSHSKSKSSFETASISISESSAKTTSISNSESSSISISAAATPSVSPSIPSSSSFSKTSSSSFSESSSLSFTNTSEMSASQSLLATETPSTSKTVSADSSQSFSTSKSISSDSSASATFNTPTFSTDITSSHEISVTQSKSAPSFGAAGTHSPSLSDKTGTKTYHYVPKYVLPEEIKNLQQVTGLATLLSSGGSVAVTQARLEAVDAMSRCGQNYQLEDDDPGFMSNPMGWKFGDPDPPTTYAKGAAVGNVVAALICAFAFCFLAVTFGLVFKGNWRTGIDIFRVPGILTIPFFILVPASSQATAVLLFNDPSPFARLAAIGSGFIMIGITMAVVVQLGRLVSSGLLSLRTLPHHKPSKAANWLNGKHWGRKFTKVTTYCFTAELGWTPFVDVVEYLDVISGKEDSSKRRQSEQAGKFCIAWGAVFEDFDLPFFVTLDVACSVVLGFCAGVAQTPNLPRLECVVTLSAAVIASSAHFFVLMYYRPCLVRATQWFLSLASGLTLLSMCLSFSFFMGQSFAYTNVMEKVMLAQAILGVFTMVVGVGTTVMLLIDFVDAFIAGKELRHMDHQTQEKLLRYKTDLQQKQNANRNMEEIKKATVKNGESAAKRRTLASEFAVLLEEMKPIPENEKMMMMMNNKKNHQNRARNAALDRQSITSSAGSNSGFNDDDDADPNNHHHEGRETPRRINIYDENDADRLLVEEMLMPNKKSKNIRDEEESEQDDENPHRGFNSYEDYLFESSSDDGDDDYELLDGGGVNPNRKILSAKKRRRLREKRLQQENEEEAKKFFVPMSPLEQAAKNKKLKQEQMKAVKSGTSLAYISPRERKRIADDIVEAQAMIRTSLDRTERENKTSEDIESANKSAASNPPSTRLPQFYNHSIVSSQAKQLQNILAKADEEKRKNEEEKYHRIIAQQQEKEKQQLELEKQRKLRKDIQAAQQREQLIKEQLRDEKIRQQRLQKMRSQSDDNRPHDFFDPDYADGDDEEEENDEENLREVDDILGKM